MKKIYKIIIITIIALLNSSFFVNASNILKPSVQETYNYKIESLQKYKKIIEPQEFNSLVNKLYLFTDFLKNSYPGYADWFFKKIVSGIEQGNREILFILNEDKNIAAISILKKETEEKKICTLYVSSSLRGKSLGSKLIEESLNYLETTKPIVTFSEDKMYMFKAFIKKYDWELCEQSYIYGNDHKELCFNGYLK